MTVAGSKPVSRWRPLPYFLAVAAIGGADLLLPRSVMLVPFLFVPIVASIALGRERYAALLLAETLAFLGMSWWVNSYDTLDVLTRAAGLTIAAVVAGRLSRQFRRERAIVRTTVDASLEPILLLKAIRDDGGRVLDFTFLDANDAAVLSFGANRERIIGARLLSVVSRAFTASPLFNAYARAMAAEGPLHIDELHYPGVDGAPDRYLDISARRIEGDQLFVTWRDVTTQVAQRRQLVESERRYRLLAQNSSDAVVYVRQGRIEWASPSLVKTLGWTPAEVIGGDLAAIVCEADLALAHERYELSMRGTSVVTRIRMGAKDGTHHWAEVHSGPFFGDNGEIIGVVGSFRIIDAEVHAEQELQRLVEFDDLTGAQNRNVAIRHLDNLLAENGGTVACLFIDIDEFKAINDVHGHAAGDRALIDLVQCARDSVRAGDTIARLGGDEFLVTLPGMRDIEDAVAVAEKIRARCAATNPERAFTFTVSIGAAFARRGETPDGLIARADAAMFAGKNAGRNTVTRVT